MWHYLQMHEKLIREIITADTADTDWEGVLALHRELIARMQHERLIHLIVTMFFALFMLLSIAYSMVNPVWNVLLLNLLFLIMTAAYVQHYFRLENGVQRWYVLEHRLEAKCGHLTAEYQWPQAKLIPAEKK